MYARNARTLANCCHSSPGILLKQRALAVHHFVVRNRQHEILGEGVQHAEGDVVVVKLAVDRIFG